jgi:DNA repair protein RadD
MYTLRPYQQKSVDAAIEYFRRDRSPAVIVLPTGAGKSLVIAELARIARGNVLVLAHVKELVEQNHAKFESYDLKAGIFSAGLERKDKGHKVTFGSIQSVARAPEDFFKEFSLLVIDECHRISLEEETQYQFIINKLKEINPSICILGLTATPYRLGMGWIYNFHHHGIVRTQEKRLFKECIYELPLSYMIRNKYLTPPVKVDSPVACYDFSSLELSNTTGKFTMADVEDLLSDQKRVTPGIIGNIVEQAKDRLGVMIFTSTVRHAKEVLSLLPSDSSMLVTGDTPDDERDEIISKFKNQELKFLVNVSVLTTGFDAPHVDLIAILRPTESISLYQQIIGRGLRLYEGKKDCLILDYTGLNYDIFTPEVGESKPTSDSEPVQVLCPGCGHANIFWGKMDSEGLVVEHFGRKCQGFHENDITREKEICEFRFRFKTCETCGAENDIAARNCNKCDAIIVDPDKKLREAMQLKDAHVLRPDTMIFEKAQDKKGKERLEVRYYDVDGEFLKESFYFENHGQKQAFYYNFARPHLKNAGAEFKVESLEQVINSFNLFRKPSFVIARKMKHFWSIREKVFDWKTTPRGIPEDLHI